MKLPKRFALSTLLLVMLAVAGVFGYAQCRRQWLKAEMKDLSSDVDPLVRTISGFRPVEFEDHWFWPTVSRQAGVVVLAREQGDFVGDGNVLTTAEAKEFLRSKAERLRRIGVKEFAYAKLVRGQTSRGPKITVVVLNDPDELKAE